MQLFRNGHFLCNAVSGAQVETATEGFGQVGEKSVHGLKVPG